MSTPPVISATPPVIVSKQFIRFLRWIADGKCIPEQIIDIVEKPHHYCPEYERFQKWEESK
jgi:hypothetical protein|tara:strand:- start:2565 stop:2747 length:183 start_codon:yes stop_codon:yes gene_type:complete